MNASSSRDKWAEWVLARSHAGDAEQKRRSLEFLGPVRDRVLENAHIDSGDVVLDVGAGDGLIAFGAMSLVGESGRIIFCDVSEDLLDHCRAAARELGVADRAEFVRAAAEDLSPIPDGSVDVVTSRSVLIYVQEKEAAFREFHRVLRPGGRVSIFEPINNYFPDDMNDFWGFDARPVRDLVEKIWVCEGWDDSNRANDPMMNFNERDLLRHAEDAGFREVHVELVVDVEPGMGRGLGPASSDRTEPERPNNRGSYQGSPHARRGRAVRCAPPTPRGRWSMPEAVSVRVRPRPTV